MYIKQVWSNFKRGDLPFAHDVLEQVILETIYKEVTGSSWNEFVEEKIKSDQSDGFLQRADLMKTEREVDSVILHFSKMSNCPPPNIHAKDDA